MDKILFIAAGSLGDVLPMLSIAELLRDKGYRVRIVADALMRVHVEERKLEYETFGGNSAQQVFKHYAKRAAGTNPFRIASQLFKMIRAPQMPHFEDVLALSECVKNARIVVASHMAAPLMHLAEKFQRPWIGFHTTPTSLPSGEYSHPIGPLSWHLAPKPQFINRFSHSAWARFAGKTTLCWVNELRTSYLGLSRLNTSRLLQATIELPRIVAASKSLFPRPDDWPESWHLTGYAKGASTSLPAMTEDVARFLDDGPKPIFVGFSSSPILDQNVWSQVIVPTARELGLRLIIGSGWSRIDVDESADCKVVETVSFEEIFPRVRCAVHAGGVGTLSEAIWSGTPSVLIPVFGEQKSIAAQAFKLGLCPRPVLLKHLNRENFTGLLKAALNDARIGEATSSASDSMRGEEGLGNAVGTIESYASRALGGQQLSNE